MDREPEFEGEDAYDVAVLGAGAAGLVAAIRAAELGARTVLVEKNRRAGVKILMSGGTRCNLTNARGLRGIHGVSGPVDPRFNPDWCRGNRSIQEAFGPGGSFLAPALRQFDVNQTIRFFELEALATKIEGNGKIFPVSDRAVDVLDVLTNRLARSGAKFRGNCPVRALRRRQDGPGFVISLPEVEIEARRVVLAVGGQSYPGCGTSGDGYAIAGDFGHSIVPTRPALVPIRVGPDWVASLRGLSLPDVVVTVHGQDGRVLQQRREAVLFAHFGLSGPAILDVSRAVARHDHPETLELWLDLLPDLHRDDLDQRLQAACRQGRVSVASALASFLPHRLAECLLDSADVPRGRVGPEFTRQERQRLVDVVKSLRLPIAGTLGFEKAEVTSGGVRLDEVDPKTLESRLAPGLHLAGEVLDLDGLIGGYNFQAAWSTGWLAGQETARRSQAD